MSVEKRVSRVINEANSKLKELVGAEIDLIKVDNEKAEVFIRIKKENSC